MQSAVKSRKSIVFLFIFSSLAAISCSFLGYLSLPIASALYASVLLYEKNGKRFASYFFPIFTFVLNFFVNGFFSLEGGAYAAIGFVIYLLYVKERSKSESAFYTSLLVFIFTVLSILILPIEKTGVFNFSYVKDFYVREFSEFKTEFLSFVSSIVERSDTGETFFVFNSYEAVELFWGMTILLIPTLMIFSFIISGISLKLFDSAIKRHSISSTRNSPWSFNTSTPTAIFYVVISFIASVATDKGVLSLSIQVLYLFFFILYAYIGIKFIFGFLSRKFGSVGAFLITVVGVCALFGVLIQIISYVGAINAIIRNRKQKSN